MQEGWSEMHSPASASGEQNVPAEVLSLSLRRAERAYRGLTIAAMVVLLVSLWLLW